MKILTSSVLAALLLGACSSSHHVESGLKVTSSSPPSTSVPGLAGSSAAAIVSPHAACIEEATAILDFVSNDTSEPSYLGAETLLGGTSSPLYIVTRAGGQALTTSHDRSRELQAIAEECTKLGDPIMTRSQLTSLEVLAPSSDDGTLRRIRVTPSTPAPATSMAASRAAEYHVNAGALAARIPGCTHVYRYTDSADAGNVDCTLLGSTITIVVYRDAADEESDRAIYATTPGYFVVGAGWITLSSAVASLSVQRHQALVVNASIGGTLVAGT